MLIKPLCLAALLIAAPAGAQQSAQLQLVAMVPVECQVQLLSVAPGPQASEVRLQTRCNVPHELELLVSAASVKAIAAVDDEGHRGRLEPGRIVLPGVMSAGTMRTIRIMHDPGRAVMLEQVLVSQRV